MDDNDLKKIADLVGERINKALEPIKQDLSGVKQDLSGVKQDLSGVKQDLSGVKQDINEIKETQKEHTRRLEALAGDTEQLLMDVKGIRDKEEMYHSRNKREIDEIKKHLDLPIIPDIPQV